MNDESLFQTLRDGAHILYDAALVHQPGGQLFEPDWWRQQGRISGEAQGRGSAWFLRPPKTAGEAGDEWVLRHYRRGGLVGRFNRDAYCYLGLEQTRPFRELRLLARLRTLALPAPDPVAAQVRRQGLFYRGDLITRRVPGQPLSRLVLAGEADPALFQAVGRVIARFHQRGVFHADLNSHNILVSGQGVYLIDFDQGRLRRPGRWQQANLARLQRSLAKVLGEAWVRETRWRECWLALEQAWRDQQASSSNKQ